MCYTDPLHVSVTVTRDLTFQLDEGGYWELKLKGTPFWNSFNSEYALRVHRLICLMIQVAAQITFFSKYLDSNLITVLSPR